MTDGAPRGLLRTTFRSLSHRNFRLYFFGQLASMIGTWMQSVAQMWLVYRLTGSGLDLGLVSFMRQFPTVLLGPWGGVIADRFDRRMVLIATQALSMIPAFLLAGLTLSHAVKVWHVYSLALCLGLIKSVDNPARQAFVVDMVDKEHLTNAIALNSSVFNAARAFGPALAGLVVALVGEGVCFLLNGLSFLCVIAGLLAMHMPRRQRRLQGQKTLRAIADGAGYALSRPHIRALLLMVGLGSMMGVPYTALMPLFAGGVLHAGPMGLGLLSGASGVGALLAALTLAARTEARGLGRWVAGAACGFGLSLMAFGTSRSLALSVGILVCTGFCMVLLLASSNTMLQLFAPDHLRGRIMSLFSMTYMGSVPLGAMLSGGLSDHIGAPWTVAGGGAIVLLAGLTMALSLPRLRRYAQAEREESQPVEV